MRYRKPKGSDDRIIIRPGNNHVDQRARERMSRSTNGTDILAMETIVKKREQAWFLRTGTPHEGRPVQIWLLHYDHRYWVVALLPHNHKILTVLGPPDDKEMLVSLREKKPLKPKEG